MKENIFLRNSKYKDINIKIPGIKMAILAGMASLSYEINKLGDVCLDHEATDSFKRCFLAMCLQSILP
jgi:hypothetical protein